MGSPVISGKELHHDGHKVHKGVKNLDSLRFSFVPGVPFVFEKGFPLKTVARICLWYDLALV
jgi:hypothetical protein